jgi:hypothetical protein
MTLTVWLEHARHDADRRGLPELGPLLEALMRATAVLRDAGWNGDAARGAHHAEDPDGR